MKWAQFKRRQPGVTWMRPFFVWTIARGLAKLLFKLLYRIQDTGYENVPDTGPIIYVCNHQSHFDPIISGIPIWDRPFTPLARATLFDTWWLALLMKPFGTVPVHQGSGRAGPMKAMLKELEAGRCVLIYPEGGRAPDGFVQRLQPGFLLVLKRSNAPLVPIALEGAYDVWPRHRRHPRFRGRIAVHVGEPIDTDELLSEGNDAALEYLRKWFETRRLELREQLRARTNGEYPPVGPPDAPYWDADETDGDGLEPPARRGSSRE